MYTPNWKSSKIRLESGVTIIDQHELACGCWFYLEEAVDGKRTKVYEICHIEHAYLVGLPSDTSRYVDKVLKMEAR